MPAAGFGEGFRAEGRNEGTELPVRVDVVCAGTPREAGFVQGESLRERIRGTRAALAKLESFVLRKPIGLPYPVFLYLAERKAERFLLEPLARRYPDLAQRLDGIAAGADLAPRALCLLNAMEAAMSSIGPMVDAGPGCACSAIAARGRRTVTGEPIIAQNFDYLPLIQPYYIIRDSRLHGRLRTLDFTVAPLCGTIGGINERGLAITYNYAYAVDVGPPAPPISMAVGEALGRFDTVAEAAGWIASQPRAGGGLLMMADAIGDVASLELANTRSRLRRPAAGEDVLFHTNRYSDPHLREVEVAPDAVYSRKAPRPLRGVRVLASPEARDARFAERLGEIDRLGSDSIASLMGDHGRSAAPDANTICMHGDYWSTTACLQLYPCGRCMRVAYASACEARYEELSL